MHSKFVRSLSYLVLVSSLAVIFYFMFKDLNWILGNDELFLATISFSDGSVINGENTLKVTGGKTAKVKYKKLRKKK